MAVTHSQNGRKCPRPRWKRRAEARPEEILEAALGEFTESGFEAARMEDVAHRAGLSKAGVYLYFPSKSALLKALIETKAAPLARQAEAIAAAGESDPLAAMRFLARVAAAVVADPKTIAVPRLVIAVSGRFPDIVEHYRDHVVAPARAAITRLLKAAMTHGQIRATDPAAVARAFIGPMFFEAMWTHILRGDSALGDPEKLVAEHFDILLNGLELRA